MTLLLVFLFSAMAISFLCSILESVLMSTPLSFITMKEEEGYRKATRFKKYKQEPSRPIAAILSLNTIANTVGAAGVGHQVTEAFGSHWFGLVSAITTILILIFAEIIPKTIGTTQWKHLMGFTTSALNLLIVLMFPLVIIIEWISKLITPEDTEAAVSREEVSAMANVAEEEEVLDEDENTLIQNLINSHANSRHSGLDVESVDRMLHLPDLFLNFVLFFLCLSIVINRPCRLDVFIYCSRKEISL